MRRISYQVRKEINADVEYKTCMLRAHRDHICGGRLTMEHALIYAGRQIDAKWAIISVCARGQEVDQYQDAHTMDKDLNHWVALNRATPAELAAISKVINYEREKARLNQIYGTYKPVLRPVPTELLGINYGKVFEVKENWA